MEETASSYKADKDKMVAEQVHLVVGHLQKEWEEHVNTLSLQLQRTKNELKQSKAANSRLVEQLELAGEIYKNGFTLRTSTPGAAKHSH